MEIQVTDLSRLSALPEVRAAIAAFDPKLVSEITFQQALADSARRHADKTAITFITDPADPAAFHSLTYRELQAEVLRAANLFRHLGIERGDPVLFIALPTLEGLIGYWGAQVAGAVAPVNPFLNVETITRIARVLKTKLLFTAGPADNDPCREKALAVAARCESLQHLVAASDLPGALRFSLARQPYPADRLQGAAAEPDDICAFFPTGGTTGLPKVARISHRSLLTGALASAIVHSCDERHVVPNGLPLFHVGGGVISTTRALLLGQTLVQLTAEGFRSPALQSHFWRLAREHSMTQLISVPTVFSDLLARYDGLPQPIELFVSGASKLPESLCNAYTQTFGRGIHEGYGMTECAGFCAANPVSLPARAGSGGLPAPFYRVRVVSLNDERAIQCDNAVNEVGAIVVSGAGVFSGYIDRTETREKFVIDPIDGSAWLDSGDLGRLDRDGYLWVTGRSKDLIIRGGHNIDPLAIEEALGSFPGIREAAAVGLPDRRVGELPIAFVEIDPGTRFDEAQALAHCRERITEQAAIPARIHCMQALPRTAMNKVFKPELRRMAAEMAVRETLSCLDASAVIEALLDEAGTVRIQVSRLPADATARRAVFSSINMLGLAYAE